MVKRQVKRFKKLIALATIINIFAQFALASSACAQDNSESFKVQFAYEMAQITTKIVSAPATNAESFKAEFAYATAQVTAKVMPLLPSDQRNSFAYEMSQITTKIISDENLDIEKAKAEFAYKIAQLTTRIISNNNSVATVGRTAPGRTTPRAAVAAGSGGNGKAAGDTDVTPETYDNLINEVAHVGDRAQKTDHKVDVDGELRYHYAFNRGSPRWKYDQAGLRLRLGFGTNIDKDWRLNGMVEGVKNLGNYYDNFGLARLYVTGKLGESTVTAGSFGYLMAEGNIYDSGYKGVKFEFGDTVKYTVSGGKTDDSQDTFIATARYNDFDYNLEAGIYHYQMDGVHTIWTLGGNYNFSNFGVGAMYLGSSQKDSNGESNGYVFTLDYGDLKTWRRGTYEVFAKYYNQPVGTYIQHGMYGLGSLMQGFRGYGLGMRYTLAPNFVGSLQYFNLKDKVVGDTGRTWWSDFTTYF